MILMYHKVDLTPKTMWWVSVDAFYQQMMDLRAYRVVTLDDYQPEDKNNIVITFDGVYKNILQYAAPILCRFGYPFELFVTSDYLGALNDFDTGEPSCNFASQDDLAVLQRYGGRLQWHSRSHPNLTHLSSNEDLLKELTVPDKLRSLDPDGFTWFAYPYGDFNPEVRSAVKDRFTGAVSCTQGTVADRFTLHRTTVVEESRFRRNTISVIVPSYNYGQFLVEAVESVLHQTRPADEIIIADDCSHDETAELAQSYVLRYPHLVKTLSNTVNLGIVATFNRAVSAALGDFICILGADNRLCSNYLERTSAILDSREDIAVAYTDYAMFGPRARMEYDALSEAYRLGVKLNQIFLVKFPDFVSSIPELTERNFVHGSSLYRKAVFEQVGGYTSERERPEDHSLFLRIATAGWKLQKASGTYLEYRQHSLNQANQRFHSFATVNFMREEIRRLKAVERTTPEALEQRFTELIVAKQCELRALQHRISVLEDSQPLQSTDSIQEPPTFLRNSDVRVPLSQFQERSFLASCLICDEGFSLSSVGDTDIQRLSQSLIALEPGVAPAVFWRGAPRALLEATIVINRTKLLDPRTLRVSLWSIEGSSAREVAMRDFEVWPTDEAFSLLSIDFQPLTLVESQGIIMCVECTNASIESYVCVATPSISL